MINYLYLFTSFTMIDVLSAILLIIWEKIAFCYRLRILCKAYNGAYLKLY